MEVEKWKRHFQKMAEGKIRPNYKGHYIVDDGQIGAGARERAIRFVTPPRREPRQTFRLDPLEFQPVENITDTSPIKLYKLLLWR